MLVLFDAGYCAGSSEQKVKILKNSKFSYHISKLSPALIHSQMNQSNPGLEGKACLEIHERIPLFRTRQAVFDHEIGEMGNRTEIEMGAARE